MMKRRKDRYTSLDLFPGLILIVEKMFYIACLLAHYRAQKDQLVSDIVQQCLAVWLASMQQPAMVCPPINKGFNGSDIARRRLPTQNDLCLHSEYLEPLRHESESNWTENGYLLEMMPLLDSFIKESSRLNELEVSTRWGKC